MNDTAQNIADDSQFIWGHLEPVDSIKHKVYRIDFLTTDVKVTIGRSEQLCDIILASRSISEVHCRLVWNGEHKVGSAAIADLNSTNHTWVGRQKLTNPNDYHWLDDGDTISFSCPDTPERDERAPTYAFIFHYNKSWLKRSGQWDIVAPLGTGTFSEVFLGRHTATGELVAMKRLKVAVLRGLVEKNKRVENLHERNERILSNMLLREMLYHFSIRHPQIVGVVGLVKEPSQRFMLLEYCEGGTLTRWMERRRSHGKHRTWDHRVAQALAYEMCTAVQLCHTSSIVHADLKPDNVLLRQASVIESVDPGYEVFDREHWGGAALGDFGISFHMEVAHSMQSGGTPAYMAPEVAYGEYPTTASDVYSLGVLVCEMATGWRPGHKDIGSTEPEPHAPGGFPSDLEIRLTELGLHPLCADWLLGMLAKNPAGRPTMKQAALHPWLVEERSLRPELLEAAMQPARRRRGTMALTADDMRDFLDECIKVEGDN